MRSLAIGDHQSASNLLEFKCLCTVYRVHTETKNVKITQKLCRKLAQNVAQKTWIENDSPSHREIFQKK